MLPDWAWLGGVGLVALHLFESGRRTKCFQLIIFTFSQIIDVSLWLESGRVETGNHCMTAGGRMLGRLLFPSVAFSQQYIKILFPPPDREGERGSQDLRKISQYSLLEMAAHMLVLTCAMHSTDCGLKSNETVEALVYAGILVYIFSLPLRIGGLYLFVFAPIFLLVREIGEVKTSAFCPYCFLYSSVFLLEPFFDLFVDWAFPPPPPQLPSPLAPATATSKKKKKA